MNAPPPDPSPPDPSPPDPSPSDPNSDDDREADRVGRRNALVAMGVVVVLVLIGWWIGDILAGVARIQDCVMAGRRNCVIFH